MPTWRGWRRRSGDGPPPRSAGSVSNQLQLWAAGLTGVILGGSAVQVDREAPWWVVMLVAAAAISAAMAVGTLAGHLHGRWLARRAARGLPVERWPR